jgi:TPP-dependent trihydroxycyclohexane-1,2-dione (THcHDO) dehydratase
MNRARADNVTQFAGIKRCDQFALTAESRKELVSETDHLSGFHVTGEWKRKIQQLIKYLINPIVSLV